MCVNDKITFAKFCPKKGNSREHGQRKAKFVNEIDDNKYVYMVDDTVCVKNDHDDTVCV